MIRYTVILLISVLVFACSDEEEVLSVDRLYSEPLIDEFSVFDPCDTISPPQYQITANVASTDEIGRLYSLNHPFGRLLVIGRSAGVTSAIDATELSYHGMTIMDDNSNDPSFVLFEDDNDEPGFQHVYILGKQSVFSTNFLFITATDALRASTFGDGDLFILKCYEIEQAGDDIQVVNSFNLNALSGNSSAIRYVYENADPPTNEELQQIERFTMQMKGGAYPFSISLQRLKLRLQLGLNQRDLRFAEGMVQSELMGQLSSKNQELIRDLDRFLELNLFSAFLCAEDGEFFTVSDDVGSGIASPLD